MSKQDKLDRVEFFVYGALAAFLLIGTCSLCDYLSQHISFNWIP